MLSAETRQKFLTELARTSNITASAEAADVNRSNLYVIRKADPVFAAAWDEALEQATDRLEQAARNRAMDGVEEYVVSGGKVVMMNGVPLTQRRYSDTLAILLLKAHRPEKFKERSAVENSGSVTLQISSDDANL